MEEWELRDKVVKAGEAKQFMEKLAEPLDSIREQVVAEFKSLAADDHEGRRHAQCMLEAIDMLEDHFATLIDNGKVAEHELSFFEKASKQVNRLFG